MRFCSFALNSVRPSTLQIVDTEAFDRSLAVNVRGVMLCYKYAARQMIKQGNGGRILGMSSLQRGQDTWLTASISRCRVDPRQTRYVPCSASEVDVSDSQNMAGGPAAASYVASKFAVRGLTQCLGRSETGLSLAINRMPSYDLLQLWNLRPTISPSMHTLPE